MRLAGWFAVPRAIVTTSAFTESLWCLALSQGEVTFQRLWDRLIILSVPPHDYVSCRIPGGLSLPLSPHPVSPGDSQFTTTPLSTRPAAGQDDPVCLWQCPGSGPAPLRGMYVETTGLLCVVLASCLTLLKERREVTGSPCSTEEFWGQVLPLTLRR